MNTRVFENYSFFKSNVTKDLIYRKIRKLNRSYLEASYTRTVIPIVKDFTLNLKIYSRQFQIQTCISEKLLNNKQDNEIK